MLQKNVAGQKWLAYAYDTTDHTAVTGDAANITAKISQDHGTRDASNDVNPTELESGYYLFDLTQAETDGDILTIIPVSATGNVQVRGVPETLQTTISAVAKDNLELMYNGTGYTDPTAPASRSQADGLSTGIGGSVNIQATSDNTGGAIIDGVTFVGSVQGATTFANTEAEDGVYHDIDDDDDVIDIVYGFAIGGARTAAAITFAGFVQAKNNEIKIKAYDHVGGGWDVIGTIEGQNQAINLLQEIALLTKHTGTGDELGNVYIRFETDSTTPSNLSVDQLLVSAVNIGQSVGYANGQIWVDTGSGVAGTEAFVNGVADQPVNLWASALTLAASVGVSDFHIINGSAIQLTGNSDNHSIFGDNWSLDLNDQSVAGAYIQGATVSGASTSDSEVHFEGCDVGVASVQIGHFDFCGFGDTLTMTLAGDYNFHDCYSKVAGAGAPVFTKTSGPTITGEWRRWSGGLTLSGIEAGDVFTISGELGTVTLNGVDGTVEIRGTYKAIIDNRGGEAVTLNMDGAIKGVDVATIRTVTDQFAFTKANEVDANTKSLNDAEVTGDGDADPWDGA